MKVLFYVLILVALYFVFCAFSDVIHLRPFSAVFELLIAFAAAYGATKIKQD
jgi:hypothetical protein